MNLQDCLYIETDDTCAICGIRSIGILTVHHIDGNRSNNTYDNQIVMCRNCHGSHHDPNFERPTSDQIRERKRHLIQKTLTTYGLSAMKIASRNDFGVIAMPFLLYHIVDMGYMAKEENQMGYGAQKDATARFAITASGKDLLAKWFGT